MSPFHYKYHTSFSFIVSFSINTSTMSMATNTRNSPVQIIKSISVCPKKDLSEPNKVVTLSNLDRQCPALMYMVFFYKSTGKDKDLSLDSAFERLRAGLEETLSVWYPAAGRLRLSSPNNLDIWCNNDGAFFVQAETGAKISDFGDLSIYNQLFENLVFKPLINNNDHGNITEMPLVTAQVTRFDCGGYSVGTGISHSLFDGISAYEFLTAWASNCNQSNSESVYKPVHERCTLLLENVPKNSSITAISMPTAIDHLYQLITQANPASSQTTQERLVFNTFHLTSTMIEKLKRNICADNASYTSFELLAAHTWKVRTKALELGTGRKVCLQFAVDARKRMVPPLPNGFSGNAYVLASILLTAEEVEEKSYECIIKLIKDAKSSVTNEYVNAYNTVLEGPHATLPPLPELTVVSDWTRVPFHTIKFFGEKATCASPLIPPVPQVTYFMRNPNDIRAVNVRIALPPNIQTAFSCAFINML